jgi:hypothetical protein
MGAVALRISSSTLRIGGGLAFGRSAFGGGQRDPGHSDPVALLHELRPGKHAAVTRSKTRRNTRLQARPYLHNIKLTWLRRHRSAPKEGVNTKTKVMSTNLSA